MLEFIRILLFGTTTLLTPQSIDIVDGGIALHLEKPISAVTSGAALYIDVSSMLPSEVNDVLEARRWVDKTFSKGVVSAELLGSSGEDKLKLTYQGSSSWSKGSVYLMLTARSVVLLGVEYDQLTLKTDTDLYAVRVKWKNHRY